MSSSWGRSSVPTPLKDVTHLMEALRQGFGRHSRGAARIAEFDKHDGPLGHEGFAREEILEDLIRRRRWIRIREHRAYWSVQFSTLSPRTKAHIRAWARAALRHGVIRDRYAEARLDGLDDGFRPRIEVARLATSSVFKEKGSGRWNLVWEEKASRELST